MPSPESFLRSLGLEPLAWDAVLQRIETQLGIEKTERFARLHRAFVAYPAEHTCRAFYDFAARENLLDALACHRFDRLLALATALESRVPAGAKVLDYGAGGGYLAAWIRASRSASVSVVDLSPGVSDALAAQGFPAPNMGETFEVLLCADSLGEIHADEDDWLSDPENTDHDSFGSEMEARYGFAHKLAALKPFLAPRGSILLFEPVSLEHFWRGAAQLLESQGWRVEILGPEPVWGLRCGA
jgi:SAM-dependent methyltransferase